MIRKKRKIIGNQFIKSFEKISRKFGDILFAQGTLYPDVIESGFGVGGKSKLSKAIIMLVCLKI